MNNNGLNLDRINELYRKSKESGLTPEEKKSKGTREIYIQSVRRNLRGQLENVSIVEKDGSITSLSKKGSDNFDK